MNPVLRTQLQGVARRPSRLLLTGLAVLVASFVVYATVLTQQIAERSLLASLSGTPAGVDLVLRDGEEMTTDLAGAIGKLPEVAEVAARADTIFNLGSEPILLIADSGSGPLAQTHLRSGRLPAAAGEITVTPRTAARAGLTVGTKVTTRTGGDGPPARLTVVGVVDGVDDFGGQAFAPLSTVTALSRSKDVRRIDVRLAAGADPDAALERVTALVDNRALVFPGDDVRQEEADDAAANLGDVFAVIGMFVAVAVVAAVLVGSSTFRIVFAQRMRQLALLRAIGAGPSGIRRALAAEGALIGLVTGLAGVLLALGAGHLLPLLLRAFGKQVFGPGVPLAPAAGTVGLAVLITVVAVLAPAVSASRVAPLEALRGSGTTGARRDIGKARWAAGLLLAGGAALVAAYVVLELPAPDDKEYTPDSLLLGVVASVALTFLALIALGPVLVRPLLAVLGVPLRRRPVGRLAAGGVGGSPRRAAAVSVVVALGVSLVTAALVGGASLSALADRQLAAMVPADYELTPIDREPITAKMVDEMRARPELAHITPYRRLEVKVGEAPVDANDLTVGALPVLGKLDTAEGSLAALGPGQVVLSANGAEATGGYVGEQITVRHGKKSVQLTVAAVLSDEAPLSSSMIVDPADLTRLGAPATYTGVLADAAGDDEKGRTAGHAALTGVGTAHGGGWKVEVLADRRDSAGEQLFIVLAIAVGLMGLTVIIAVVGVGTTTALSVVERVRESGLLRAIGLSRGGLRVMLTTESALYGVIGAALGLVLGVPYAWLTVKALGVNAPFTVPAGQLVLVFVILVLLTAAAGALPARRAAKVSPVAALGTE